MNARTVQVAVAALVVLAGPMAACSKDDPAEAPTSSTAASTPTTPPTSVGVATTQRPPDAAPTFRIWLLRDGKLSTGELRTTAEPDVARASLEALIAGPTPVEEDLNLQTGVSTAVRILSYEQQGDTLIVGFNRVFETAQTRPQVAQVVWTLTQFAGIARVQFLIDGEPNGATGVPPISRADVTDVLPPVLLDTPTPPAVLDATAVLAGSVAPGAEVGWRLENGFGATIASGRADRTAPTPGDDGRSAWEADVTYPADAVGTGRLVVYEASTPAEVFPQVVPVTLTP